MTLLAVLASGLAAFLLAGSLLGLLPQPRRRSTARISRRQEWLTQAGVALTPSQFWLASTVVGVTVFLLALALTATPVVALAPALGAACLPGAAIARQRNRRLRAVQEAWPDGLRELLASVAAGRSLAQALQVLAADGPPALRATFSRYPQLARVVGTAAALEAIKAELADPTSDRVLDVLVVAHERGGPAVVEILHDLADDTVRDLRTLEGIATDALEQRLNAGAVFLLPWLVLVLLTARAGPFRDFYQRPGGLLVVLIGAVMSAVGLLAVQRLAGRPTEERVLVSDDEVVLP